MTRLTLTSTHLSLIATLLTVAAPGFAQAPDTRQAPDPASAPAPEKKHGFEVPKIGIDLGVYLPSSGRTRQRFGNSWTNVGIGIGRPDTPSSDGRIGLDFGVISKSSGSHHVFVAPLGIYYRRAFSAGDVLEHRSLIPYYGVSADLVILDLRSPEDNVHSRFRLGYGGSAVIGTTIGASGFAEAKYLGIGKVKGFDLSGLNLTVGARF